MGCLSVRWETKSSRNVARFRDPAAFRQTGGLFTSVANNASRRVKTSVRDSGGGAYDEPGAVQFLFHAIPFHDVVGLADTLTRLHSSFGSPQRVSLQRVRPSVGEPTHPFCWRKVIRNVGLSSCFIG